jgi:hypothetical protein
LQFASGEIGCLNRNCVAHNEYLDEAVWIFGRPGRKATEHSGAKDRAVRQIDGQSDSIGHWPGDGEIVDSGSTLKRKCPIGRNAGPLVLSLEPSDPPSVVAIVLHPLQSRAVMRAGSTHAGQAAISGTTSFVYGMVSLLEDYQRYRNDSGLSWREVPAHRQAFKPLALARVGFDDRARGGGEVELKDAIVRGVRGIDNLDRIP